MNKAEESESSNDEETYQDYFTNPQKRKQFDSQRLYQQQKELQKMSGFNKQIVIEPPKRITDADNHRNYATVSLFCLTVTNPFRDKVIRIVLNQWFDRFILLIIVVNCVFLAIDDPNLDQLDYQIIADYIFLVIFTVEMCLKIIAMGFGLRPYSYLRDTWNILDFIVVIMGWISKVVTANNVSAIRVIRILRPLRTINSMPGMRKLVQSLLNSLPTLFDILVLFSFFLVMFGTIATQLFGGLLQSRCIDDAGNVQTGDDGDGFFCKIDDACPGTWVCRNIGNPDFEVTSFDNILKSVLNIFIIITLEGWTDVMYKIRSATGTVAYDIFFILVVILGAFFILNLMVAVQFSYLNAQFQEQKSKIEAQKQKETNALLRIKDETPNSPQKAILLQQIKFNGGFSQALQEVDEVDDQAMNKSNNDRNSDKLQQQSPSYQQNKQEVIPEGLGPEEKIIKKSRCIKMRVVKTKISVLVDSKEFNILIIVLIMINTVFMAMEYYEMPDKLTMAVNTGNSILTCIFAVEMILKLIGLGIKSYMKDGFNVFDAIIVIVGLLEFVNAGSKVLTVLRAFRLLRIFKIVKSWTTLKKLLQTVLSSFSSIANLGLLMFLLIFIYSLIGMQFFSGDIPDNPENSFRFNFNTFGNSLITIFVLLTAENWNSILIQFIDKDGFPASIYFVSMIIFGNIMILNLFLAILLSFISENLDQDEQKDSDADNNGAQAENNEVVEEQFDYIQERLRIKAGIKLQQEKKQEEQEQSPLGFNQENKKEELKQQNDLSVMKNKIDDISINLNNEGKISEKSNEESNNGLHLKDNLASGDNTQKSKFDRSDISKSSKLPLDKSQTFNKSISNPDSVSNLLKSSKKKSFKTKNTPTILNIQGRSLFIFSQDSKVRTTLKAILTHPYFENFIYHLIGLNSLILALAEPQLTDSYQTQTLDLCVTIISGIFIAEAIAKIIVLGFVKGNDTYLRDPWNVLDFTIVSFSVLNWILDSFSSISVSFLRGFRALRALRPLRMVSKNEGMKIVVNSLLTSIPNLFNVMLISLLFYLVFGILGVQLFKGAMGSCNDTSIDYKWNCVDQFKDPSSGSQTDRQWNVPFNNFDNIFYSMVTFFEIATLENWPAVLFAAIDSQDIDYGPKLDNRPYIAFLFVVFIFITTFFVMNLFISVIVDKFNEEIKKKEGSHKFSEEQKEWVKMQRIMVHVNLKIKPISPDHNKFRKFFFIIVMSKQFEFFISFIISVNTLFLCMDYYEAPANYSNALQLGNIIFVSLFACEALMKMIAHGIRFYFLETWNKFDFVIVLLSLIALDETIFSFKVNALRIIRVARLLRMIKASKGLRHLLKTLWLSMGNIANVGMLLFLIFFTFTVAGMDLFGSMYNSQYISDNANFRSFYITIVLLFRASTGENWNGVMHDCYDQTGIIAVIYWLAFQIITHYIFLNVFIAVIYENFNDVKASEDENEVLSLKRKDIKAFVRTWAIFCPNGEHYMKTIQFSSFLMKLPPPLGYEGHKIEQSKLNKIIFCLNIKNHLRDDEGKVYFPEVMWAIFHSIIGNNDEQVHNCEQVINIMKELKRKYKGLGKHLTPDSLCGNRYYRTEMTVSKYMCALQIYKNWRRFKTQREKNKEMKLNALNQNNTQNFDNNNVSNNLGVNQMTDQKASDYSDAQLLNQDQNNVQQRLNDNIDNQGSQGPNNYDRINSKDSEEQKLRSRDEPLTLQLRSNQQNSQTFFNVNEQSPNVYSQKDNQNQNVSNFANEAINEEPESSFQSEELSEDVSSDRSQKDRYFDQNNTQQDNNKQVMVDFALIKGQMKIQDFINGKGSLEDQNESNASDRTVKRDNFKQDMNKNGILNKNKSQ